MLPKSPKFQEKERASELAIFEDEAINGVAFFEDMVAVSSRAEVTLRKVSSDLDSLRVIASYEGGSHGVVATEAGRFVAPLGHDGLLFMRGDAEQSTIEVGQIADGCANFYKIISLKSESNGEVLAAAARSSGLLAISLRTGSSKPSVLGHRTENMDIVDICSLDSTSAPRAVVGLDHSGRLVWSMDIFESKQPLVLDLGDLAGTPYSILSARGHLFILTSSELIALPHMVRRFLDGEEIDRRIIANSLEISAVDAFLLNDDELFVTAEDRDVSHRVNDLVARFASAPHALSSDQNHRIALNPSFLRPDWLPQEPIVNNRIGA